MNAVQREIFFVMVGRARSALDCWRTSLHLRLAHTGSCPACGIHFRHGIDAVGDAFHHVHASPICSGIIVQQIEQPAWEAEQARVHRRGESTHWRSVRSAHCAQCGGTFFSVRRRRYCGAPICARMVSRARKQRWQARRQPTERRRCVCAFCQRPFTARRRDARFCGPACRQRLRRHGLQEHIAGVMFPLPVTGNVRAPAMELDVSDNARSHAQEPAR